MVAEYNSAGTMLRRYIHGPALDADDPLVWYEGSGIAATDARLLLRDPRGSIVNARNSSGSFNAINTYDEYGIPGYSNQGRFQYTGQVWLNELGMYYYKARIYSPTLGRFLQTDPIGYEDNVNLYAYVANDPVNGVDPTGMQELTAWPVPGHTELNERDPSRGQGGGEFGAPRSGGRSHEGIDINAPVGATVVAAGDGTVVNIQPNPSTSYGVQVVIDHGGDVYTQSAHLESSSVKPGDTVTAGDPIGAVGKTGNTPRNADSHLHFEVRIGDPGPRAPVEDPMDHLPSPTPPEPAEVAAPSRRQLLERNN